MKKLLRKVIEEYVALSYNPRIVFKNFVLPFYIHVFLFRCFRFLCFSWLSLQHGSIVANCQYNTSQYCQHCFYIIHGLCLIEISTGTYFWCTHLNYLFFFSLYDVHNYQVFNCGSTIVHLQILTLILFKSSLEKAELYYTYNHHIYFNYRQHGYR